MTPTTILAVLRDLWPALIPFAVLGVAWCVARVLVRHTPAPRPPLRVIRGDAPRQSCERCRGTLTEPTWPDDDGPYLPPAA